MLMNEGRQLLPTPGAHTAGARQKQVELQQASYTSTVNTHI